MIDIEEVSADNLKRTLWSFSSHDSGGTHYLRLTRLAIEARASTRHKFRPDALWDSMDERYYHSNLPRPASIPQWVAEEALAAMPKPVITIGWADRKYEAKIVPAQDVEAVKQGKVE